jgi:hypothetical protein
MPIRPTPRRGAVAGRARPARAAASFVLVLATVLSRPAPLRAQEPVPAPAPTPTPVQVPSPAGPPSGRPMGPGGPGRPGGAGGMGGAGAALAGMPAVDMSRAPRVFLDCQSRGPAGGSCDFDFIRTEVTFANFVRDRFDSDVHVLVTTLQAGNGGREYTVAFIGQKTLTGSIDTLRYVTAPNDADDVLRRRLVQTIRVGLVRWVARTPLAPRLMIGFASGGVQQASPQSVRDPWNFWLFTVRANGNGNGEQLRRTLNTTGSFSADRVTEQWKLNLGVTGSYNFSQFTLRDGNRFENLLRSYGASALVVRSLTDHWSAGVRTQYVFSDFFNQDVAFTFAPAVEWNLFPYTEATRRQFTVLYTLATNHYEYQRRTVFDRLSENRFNQTLLVALNTRQRWGNVRSTLEASNYLHDMGLYHLTLSGFTDLRLGRGLAFNLGGEVSRVRDQLYLPAAGNTDNEIIVNRNALPTSFRFNFFAGLTYTFGSIYNTVVNPRFGLTGQRGAFRVQN